MVEIRGKNNLQDRPRVSISESGFSAVLNKPGTGEEKEKISDGKVQTAAGLDEFFHFIKASD